MSPSDVVNGQTSPIILRMSAVVIIDSSSKSQTLVDVLTSQFSVLMKTIFIQEIFHIDILLLLLLYEKNVGCRFFSIFIFHFSLCESRISVSFHI